MKCKDTYQPKYSFDMKRMEVYKDYEYFGVIESFDGKTFKVKVDNGNKYMEGQIIEITLN